MGDGLVDISSIGDILIKVDWSSIVMLSVSIKLHLFNLFNALIDMI